MRTPSAQSVAGVILIVFAVGATVVGLRRQSTADGASATTAVTAPESPDAESRPEPVTVYYFHGDTRCATCRAIETQTTRVVQERFDQELASEKLRFEIVNFEAPANEHFRGDYDLAFGSVVVQGIGEDRPWENLADVWTLIHEDPAVFEVYLVEHVRRMLEPAG